MTSRESSKKASSDKTPLRKNQEEAAAERRRRIAEAAYYNAERRGFQGEREIEDWLEAEREIDSRASGAGIQHEASALAEGPGDVSTPAIKESAGSAANGEMIEPDRVKQWARKLKVPASRLREAIARVGPVVKDVKHFLESGSSGR